MLRLPFHIKHPVKLHQWAQKHHVPSPLLQAALGARMSSGVMGSESRSDTTSRQYSYPSRYFPESENFRGPQRQYLSQSHDLRYAHRCNSLWGISSQSWNVLQRSEAPQIDRANRATLLLRLQDSGLSDHFLEAYDVFHLPTEELRGLAHLVVTIPIEALNELTKATQKPSNPVNHSPFMSPSFHGVPIYRILFRFGNSLHIPNMAEALTQIFITLSPSKQSRYQIGDIISLYLSAMIYEQNGHGRVESFDVVRTPQDVRDGKEPVTVSFDYYNDTREMAEEFKAHANPIAPEKKDKHITNRKKQYGNVLMWLRQSPRRQSPRRQFRLRIWGHNANLHIKVLADLINGDPELSERIHVVLYYYQDHQPYFTGSLEEAPLAIAENTSLDINEWKNLRESNDTVKLHHDMKREGDGILLETQDEPIHDMTRLRDRLGIIASLFANAMPARYHEYFHDTVNDLTMAIDDFEENYRSLGIHENQFPAVMEALKYMYKCWGNMFQYLSQTKIDRFLGSVMRLSFELNELNARAANDQEAA